MTILRVISTYGTGDLARKCLGVLYYKEDFRLRCAGRKCGQSVIITMREDTLQQRRDW